MLHLAKYKYYFLAVDYLILQLGTLIAVYICMILVPDQYLINEPFTTELVYSLIIMPALYLSTFHFNYLYQSNIILTKAIHYTYLIRSFIYLLVPIFLLFTIMMTHHFVASLYFVLVFTSATLLIMYVIRVELLRYLYLELNKNRLRRRILIIGDGRSGKLLAAKLMVENSVGLNIVGFIHEELPIGETIIGDIQVIGRLNDLERITSEFRIDELIVAQDKIAPDELFDLVKYCKQYVPNTNITSSILSIISQKVPVEKYADIPIVELTTSTNSKPRIIFKRLFDITISLLGLIALTPFFVAVGLVIKLTSAGPIIFKQTRIGKDGKPFDFYKFRTMKTLDEEDEKRKEMMLNYMKDENTASKVIDEKRITKIGKFLRKYSLDELPQLYNVLIGDMSIVGPRPCLPYEYENYESWQRKRTSVTPGCTGIWQVFGRSSVSFKESVILDLYYISNMTPWLDLQLILKTIPVVVFGRGGK